MKKIFSFILVLGLLFSTLQFKTVDVSASEQRVTIIEKKDEWSYYNEAPTQLPGDDWYKIDYDSSSWKVGHGIFGYKNTTPFDTGLNYGPDADNKYPTYFFRKTFNLDLDVLKQLDTMVFNLNADDGAIIFLNNQEVMRYNYPENTPIDYTKGVSALGGNGKVYNEFEKSIDELTLVDGENTISVVLFQQKPDSSDVAFDLELYAEAKVLDYTPLRLSQTFYGDIETQKGFTWHTEDEAGSSIRYIQANANPNAIGDDFLVEGLSNKKAGIKGYTHKVVLDNLEPNTQYWYQVGDSQKDIWSDIYSFETGSQKEDVNFAFITDSQGWEDEHYSLSGETMRQAIKTLPNLDFFIQGGDLVDTSANDSQWNSLFERASDVWANYTVMTVSGNHDTEDETFNDHFNYEYPNQDIKEGTYYSFDYNDVHFVMLNTNDANRNGMGQGQVDWLRHDLEQAQKNGAQWIIVTMHKGTQTVATHIDDSDVVAMRAQLQPIFTEYNVDLVLQGHDHVYSRTVPLDGLKPELNVNSFVSSDSKVLSNPLGTTYLNANSSGVKFYQPWSDEDIAKYQVYPDVKLQDSKQTYVTFEIDEESLKLNSYSFSVKDNEEPQLIDSLEVLKNDKSKLENMIDDMPSSVSDDSNLFDEIETLMNGFAYEDRVKQYGYDKYLNLLSQVGKTVELQFGDELTILHETGNPILELPQANYDGLTFKHWVDQFGKVLNAGTLIKENQTYKAVYEALDLDSSITKPNEPETPGIDTEDKGEEPDDNNQSPKPDTPNPTEKPSPSDKVDQDQDTVLPNTGINTYMSYFAGISMLVTGTGITIRKRKFDQI